MNLCNIVKDYILTKQVIPTYPDTQYKLNKFYLHESSLP